MALVPAISILLSLLTIFGQVIFVVLLTSLLLRQRSAVARRIFKFFARNALLFAFFAALGATAGSLFYSEIAGFEPCKLCWFQRIFIYPQVLFLGMALWSKDEKVGRYGIVFSVFGGSIALYHFLLQLGVAPALPCSAATSAVSCSQRFVLAFGYITIPLMALTVFVLIILLFSAQKLLLRDATRGV